MRNSKEREGQEPELTPSQLELLSQLTENIAEHDQGDVLKTFYVGAVIFADIYDYDDHDLEVVSVYLMARLKEKTDLGLKVGKLRKRVAATLAEMIKVNHEASPETKLSHALELIKNSVLQAYLFKSISLFELQGFLEDCFNELESVWLHIDGYEIINKYEDRKVQLELLQEWGVFFESDDQESDGL